MNEKLVTRIKPLGFDSATWNTWTMNIPTPVNITRLDEGVTVDTNLIRQQPQKTEQEIRSQIALQLAIKLIDEDLIDFSSDEDIPFGTTTIHGTIKIVQE